MKFAWSVFNAEYPLYGAQFLDNETLLVGGGGGEGHNGVPNKLSTVVVNGSSDGVEMKLGQECLLDENGDSPTALDAAEGVILLGCNENSEKVAKTKSNEHLKKYIYQDQKLKFQQATDLEHSTNTEEYTKLLYLSKDSSAGAMCYSKIPSVIRIMDPADLSERYEIETGHEVKDMHFSPTGKLIGYITKTTLEVISIVTGRVIIRKTDFDKSTTLAKIRFMDDDTILLVTMHSNSNSKTGIYMTKLSVKGGDITVIQKNLITKAFRGVVSMDVDQKGEVAALASNDNSIVLVRLRDMSVGKTFKEAHSFAITKVVFSPNSRLVASISASGTIHMIYVPVAFPHSTPMGQQLQHFIKNFVLVVLLALLIQLIIKYDIHNKVYSLGKAKYINGFKKDEFSNDSLEPTTLIGNVTMSTDISFEVSSPSPN